MDILNVQSLIANGLITEFSSIDPTKAYLQIGVFQPGNRQRGAGNADAYKSYAISVAEILSGATGGVTSANNGLTVNSGIVQLGGSLITPTTITAGLVNSFEVVDSYGTLLKSRDSNMNTSWLDYGGNVITNSTNITSYVSTGNTYLDSNIVLNFGSIGDYDTAVDVFNFGDYTTIANSSVVYNFGRNNSVTTNSQQVSIYGNFNTVSNTTNTTIVGSSNTVSNKTNLFIIGNSDKNLVVDGANGNVGINNYAPTYKLDITGTVRSYINSTSSMVYDGNELKLNGLNGGIGGGSYLTFTAIPARSYNLIRSSSDLGLSGDGTYSNMIIRSSGRVGIGTETPGTITHIVSTADTGLRVETNAAGSYTGKKFQIEVGGGQWGFGFSAGQNALTALTTGSSTGNFIFGYGTESVPVAHFNYDSVYGGFAVNVALGSMNAAGHFRMAVVGNPTDNILLVDTSGGVSRFLVQNNGVAKFNSSLDGETAGSDNWSYAVSTGGSITSFYANTGYGSTTKYFTNAVLKTTINDSTGYFAISTTNRFSVKTIADNKSHLFMDGASGFIGIGNDYFAPTSQLQVTGLPTYADNTAALAGSLTAGAFYIRTGHGLDVVV